MTLDFVAPNSKVDVIRAKYEALINNGRAQAVETLTRVEAERPQDMLVHTDAFKFRAGDNNRLVVDVGKNGGTRTFQVHKNALDQSVAKTGIICSTTARKLMEQQQPWATDLLADALNRTYTNIDRERVLLRSVGDMVKGVLSDKYRRLDSGPIFESYVRAMQLFGAVPTFGRVYDTKVTLTMTLPEIFDPVPNDPKGLCVIGATLGNSDFGDGAVWLKFFILRLICLNGAMREDAFRQVHLGRRLSDDFAFSEETYRLDTQTTMSAMSDLIRGLMDPSKINAEMAMIRKASETEVDVGKLFASLRQLGNLTKAEEKLLVATYNTPDIELLPPGNNLWRASNALSLFAQDTSLSPERALEIQMLAGSVLDRKAA